jgi:hypothetical protein
MPQRARYLVLGVVLAGIGAGSGSLPAAGQTQGLTAQEIVTRMAAKDQERQAALERYGSQRTYRMEYRGPIGERKAEMRVRMDFSAPDRKRFTVLSESGSTLFCHQILRRLMEGEQEGALEENHRRSMLSVANDDVKLVGEEQIGGVDAWVLDVTPKIADRFNYKGRVWVGVEDYAVVRIVGSPAKSPTWLMGSAEFDYRYGRGGEGEAAAFWLPQRNVTVSRLRIGGEITLTVEYGTYEIVSRPGGVVGGSGALGAVAANASLGKGQGTGQP